MLNKTQTNRWGRERDKKMQRRLRNAFIGLFGVALTILAAGLNEFTLSPQPALAQWIRPQSAGEEVYKLLPDFPKENNYINRDSGKVDANNTLALRLIQYHMYVKGRPPIYRLDWKLTLADYLGANDLIEKGVYPGHETLKDNPIESDRAAISRLNRIQRESLVDALVKIFSIQSPETSQPKPAPSLTPAPQPESETKPPITQPGSADLLK